MVSRFGQVVGATIAAAGVLIATSASAGTIALTATPGSLMPGHDGAGETLGWSFTAKSAITVMSLGVFDAAGDGLANNHAVGLWDSSGQLLSWVVVSAGSQSPLDSYFRFASITPVPLSSGAVYVVGAHYQSPSDADQWFGNAAGGITTDPQITYGGRRIASVYSADLLFPNVPGNAGYADGYFGANFLIDDSTGGGPAAPAVPEPASMLLLGTGLVGAVGAWRTRRRDSRYTGANRQPK